MHKGQYQEYIGKQYAFKQITHQFPQLNINFYKVSKYCVNYKTKVLLDKTRVLLIQSPVIHICTYLKVDNYIPSFFVFHQTKMFEYI